ncbi:MAG: glycerophosphodiester phosphodiesterase family protein [Planctomycetota bacterium]
MRPKEMLRDIVHGIRRNWRVLVATDVMYKAFAFCVLTPLLGLCQRATIWLASEGLLSDADFVFLLTKPVGLIGLVVVASIWLAITGLEQASLLVVLWSSHRDDSTTCFAAIGHALARAQTVLKLTAALSAASLAVILPLAGLAFLVYRGLLGEFDINFYLHSEPDEFRLALSIGVVLAALAVVGILGLGSAWFLALPIAVLENLPARKALRLSHEHLRPVRRKVLAWLVTWFATVLLSNLLLAAVGGWIGRLLLPSDVGSLVTLAARVGTLILTLACISLLLNLIANVTFAAMVHAGYQTFRFNPESHSVERNQLASQSLAPVSINRSRAFVILCFGILVATWLGVRSLWSLPLKDKAAVMAHRGASGEAPENTMAAFQRAIDEGADWIELDVQESADGQVIVMHDSDFMRQARVPLKVWDADQSQLEGIDIGSWMDPSFAAERVPRLSEVLELCRDRVGVIIELKYYGHDERLEHSVVEIVESAGMSDRVMIMSLKKEGVLKAKNLRPTWKCGLLLSIHAGNLKRVDVDFVAINSRFATHAFVRDMHAAGKEVYVWTVNDAATMSQMLNRGVDGLLTDRPALARRVLEERATMSPPERLLSEVSAWLLGEQTASEFD